MKIINGFFVLYLSFGLILFACGGGSGGGGVTGIGGGGLGSGGGNGGGDGGGGDGGGTASSISTTRVSVSSGGTQGNISSSAPSISSDGRYVAFESNADNLVDADTNGVKDIFVYDRDTGTTGRVSVSSGGVQGNSISSAPSISSDGRYVAFESSAANLVSGDTNGVTDIFIHDRNTEVTGMVSIAADGTQGNGISSAPSISSDGRYIAFESSAANLVSGDTNGVKDIFIYDSIDAITTRVSVGSSGIQGNSISSAPSISLNGQHVVFESLANNLVAGDTRGLQDIFVHDRDSDGNSVFDETGIGQTATIRVSVDSDGNEAAGGNSSAPSISSDGKHVAFESIAANLVTGDTNGLRDIFVNGP